jgi:hypothetical protein
MFSHIDLTGLMHKRVFSFFAGTRIMIDQVLVKTCQVFYCFGFLAENKVLRNG